MIDLAHKGEPKPPYTPGYDLLPEVPRQALLMPEWLPFPDAAAEIDAMWSEFERTL